LLCYHNKRVGRQFSAYEKIFFLKWDRRKSTDPDRASPGGDLYFILMHHWRDIYTSCCMLLYEALLLKLFILSAQQEIKV